MPIDIATSILFDGTDSVPGWQYIKTIAPALLAIGGTKYYFGGTHNTWERDLHGKVYIITGGTSGLGAQVAYELAKKGAQLVLLVRSLEDQWIIDFVDDLRERSNNYLIYAEECDLASLYSVRKFATKFLDNQPPRRLDGVVCLAAETIPVGSPKQLTVDGVERQLGINYLSHYHLLTLLSPSLRVQPPDRDVQIVVATCSSQALGEVDLDMKYSKKTPFKNYGTSKLLLGMFVKQFQRENDNYERKDKHPCNIKVNMVNPGLMRSASTRRFLSMGSLLGLFVYILFYPIFWLVLKNSYQGAQSVLFVLTAPFIAKIAGGNYIQECKIILNTRKEYDDEKLVKQVYDETEKLISKLEKQSAIERKKQELIDKKDPKYQEKQADLTKKPESADELQSKLNKIRKDLNIGSTTGDLPLFPDQS